jgi:predicted nucleic acid-binding protein
VIVLDASAALEVLLGTPAAGPIAERIFAPEESLHVPHLFDVEVLQVVRLYCRIGEIDAERGREAVEDLEDLTAERYPHEPLLRRIWELRDNATAYDAAYLALAELLEAPLVTCDGRLLGAAQAAGFDLPVEHYPSSGRGD